MADYNKENREKIREKIRTEKLFVTASSREKGSDSIVTSVYQQMSKSFATNEYLDDSAIYEEQGAVIYQLQQVQKDIQDIHTEVSQSVYVSQVSNFSSIATASFGNISSSLIPDKDNTYDLGSSTKEFKDLYVDGTANLDTAVITSATIAKQGGTIGTFTGGDTTPSVGLCDRWLTSNARSISITTFDDAVEGQMITIIFGDANTTLVHDARAMLLNGARNWTAASGDTITLIYNRAWYEVCRSDNT